MEAARRRAVRDLREIAEEAEAPAGSDGAALRRRLAELRQRVLAVARALGDAPPPPPPRGARRLPDPLRPHNAPAAPPAKPAPPAAEAPDAVAAAAGRLAEAAYRALERLFGVVDADYREAPERRAATPLDATSQTRFRRVLEAVAGGRVRRCLDAPPPPRARATASTRCRSSARRLLRAAPSDPAGASASSAISRRSRTARRRAASMVSRAAQ